MSVMKYATWSIRVCRGLTRRRAVGLLCTALIVMVTACGGRSFVESEMLPDYRSPAEDFARYSTVKLHFVSLLANHLDPRDMLSVFRESLVRHLAPRFPSVVEGSTASPGELLLNIKIEAFHDRAFGSSGLMVQYELSSWDGELLARFSRSRIDRQDPYQPSIQNNLRIIEASAEDWNEIFVRELFTASPPAERAPPSDVR